MTEQLSLAERLLLLADQQPAALFIAGQQRLSYAAAAAAVNDQARRLHRAAAGLPVLIAGAQSAEWVLSLLAANHAGCLAVVLAAETTPAQLAAITAMLGAHYRYDPRDNSGARYGERARADLPPAAALALPTSGSTGEPRYALRSGASLLAEGERYTRAFRLDPDDRILTAIPLYHAFALGLALGGALAAGCTICLAPGFIPRALWRMLMEGQGTIVPLAPAAARILCATPGIAAPAAPLVRACIVGAGRLDSPLERQLTGCLGLRPARNYGSSETGATLGSVGQAAAEGVTGWPLPGVEAALGGGPEGALFVRTATPFLGYLQPDGIDSSRISPDGWYATGDIARRDPDGAMTVVRRLGEGLRRGGRVIQPAEITRALLHHAAVSDACITADRDEHGEDVVVAHVEVQAGAQLDAETLRRHLLAYVEPYKLPMRWRFYDRLPRTAGGKPARNQLTGAPAGTAPLEFFAAARVARAMLAAHRSGMIARLRAEPCNASVLAADLGLDAESVSALLAILAAADLAGQTEGGRWTPGPALCAPPIDTLLDLEATLDETWLALHQVEEALRLGVAGRAFEREPGDRFLAHYRATMAASARSMALHILRMLARPCGPTLEIGRPAGAWAALLRQRSAPPPLLSIELPAGNAPLDGAVALPAGPLEGAVIFNAVRRLADPAGPLALERLAAHIAPGGFLAISDIFTDTPGGAAWLRPALQLDWLTHGALVWPTGAEVCRALTGWGFTPTRRQQLDPLFELIIARKVADAPS